MSKFLIALLLVFSFSAFAEEKEAHGNPDDEARCFREIRSMGCGNADQHETFIACVDRNIQKLSRECQVFHREEVARMKSHKHSH